MVEKGIFKTCLGHTNILKALEKFKTINDDKLQSVATVIRSYICDSRPKEVQDTRNKPNSLEASIDVDKTKNKDIDILLLGKTGNGKSATGNSILGREVFECSDDVESVTCLVKHGYGWFDGRKIKVVDCPGISDTENIKDNEKVTLKLIEQMHEAVKDHPNGYHAFILVVKYGGRFTCEDKRVIEMLKRIFGHTIVKDYCILIMTYGDNYRSNKQNKNRHFNTWCTEQNGVIKELLGECENRVILFDNNTDDPTVKSKQLTELIETIDKLQYGSRRYCDMHFEAAEERRRELLIECKEPRITEDIRQKCSIILERSKYISKSKEDDNQLTELESLLIESEDLKKEVLELDQETGVLITAIELTNHLGGSISQQIHICTIKMEKLAMEKEKEQITKEYEENMLNYKVEVNKQNACMQKELFEIITQYGKAYSDRMTAIEKRIEEKDKKINEEQLAFKTIIAEIERKYENLKIEMEKQNDEFKKDNDKFRAMNSAWYKRVKNVIIPLK